jgi:fused signal recognition particle receptor
LVAKRRLGADDLGLLEEILLSADVGPHATRTILDRLSPQLVNRDITAHDLRKMLAEVIADILAPCAKPLLIKRPDRGPFTMLICGVNGAGKTTTIGKLAKIMHDQKHHRVLLAAGDTFRAAAVEQLMVWGARAHCAVVTRDIGADAAALAFEAWEEARRDRHEVLMIDTAGRLQNKTNLMQELEKIVRVLRKHDAALPHEVLLVLDGTTGQNAIAQVQTFRDMVGVTGLIVTKLDGSAKGGVVVALAHQFGLPIYAVGVGETAEDLQPFTAKGYAAALVGNA